MGIEYAKYNAQDKGTNIILVSDYEISRNGSGWETCRCTNPKSSGKPYIEIEMTMSQTYVAFGIGPSTSDLGYYVGSSTVADSWGWIDQSASVRYNNGNVSTGMGADNGDFVGMAVDLDNNKIWFSKNGNWAWGTGQGNPSTGTGGIDISLRGTDDMYIMGSVYASPYRFQLNCGQKDFEYPAPTGFDEGWFIETYLGTYNGYTMLQGSPVSRIVRLYDDDTGTLQDETTSSGNGYYSLETTYSGSHYIVCLDDTEDYNHLINKGVVSYEEIG